jgi:hypothetical protein
MESGLGLIQVIEKSSLFFGSQTTVKKDRPRFDRFLGEFFALTGIGVPSSEENSLL